MIKEPVAILANGNFPSHPIPLGILMDAYTIICCDGSANNLEEVGMEPNYILGDIDSIDDDLKNKYKERIIKLPEQDENYLRKAILWAERKRTKKADILGATGMRDDHTVANIFTLLQYPSKIEMTMYTNHGIFSVVEDKRKFDSFTGQKISLFSTDPKIEVTSNKLKYNLNNKVLTNLYNGSLNESLGKSFSLRISHGKILVYQVFA